MLTLFEMTLLEISTDKNAHFGNGNKFLWLKSRKYEMYKKSVK